MGVVEAVGADVRTLRPGQRVIAPFAYSDGTCDFCAQGLQTSCRTGGYWGGQDDGGQGEAVRAPLADGTLVPLPDDVDLSDDRLAAALATLTDVMGTGHHGAITRASRPAPRSWWSATARWACARCWPRAAGRGADHRDGPPRRPPGDRPRLRRDGRGGRAGRRGGRAGPRAHRRRPGARGRGGRARPARSRRRSTSPGPGGPWATSASPPSRSTSLPGAHAEHPPARRRRAGARLHRGADGGHPRRHASTPPRSSTPSSAWRRSRRATRRWTSGGPEGAGADGGGVAVAQFRRRPPGAGVVASVTSSARNGARNGPTRRR